MSRPGTRAVPLRVRRWVASLAIIVGGALAISGGLAAAAYADSTVRRQTKTVIEGKDGILQFSVPIVCPAASPGDSRQCGVDHAWVQSGSAVRGRDWIAPPPFIASAPEEGQAVVPYSPVPVNHQEFVWYANQTGLLSLPQPIEIESDPYPVPGPDESFSIVFVVTNQYDCSRVNGPCVMVNGQPEYSAETDTTYVQPIVIHHRFTIHKLVAGSPAFQLLSGLKSEGLSLRKLNGKGFVRRDGQWFQEKLVVSRHKQREKLNFVVSAPGVAPSSPSSGPPPPASGPPSPAQLGLSCPQNTTHLLPASFSATGLLTPAAAGSPVTLTYTPPGGQSFTDTAATDANGNYSDSFTASSYGTWSVQAHFAGDGTRTAADASCSFQIFYPGQVG